MKSKSVFLLIAAVAVMGLLSGCPEVPETPSNNVTVKFDTDGGEPATIESITLKKGETLGDNYPSSDPTKTDYIFDGWYYGEDEYKDDTPITASITLTARWIYKDDADLITINLNPDNTGTVISIKVLRNKSMGNQYPTPTYPEDLKEFAGWWQNLGNPTTEREIEADTPIDFLPATTKSLALKAKWNPIPVIVSFDSNGGDPATIAPVTLNKGETLGTELPANPTKTDFLFGGWYTPDDTEYETRYIAAEPRVMATITLKARWQDASSLPSVTVTFKRNNTDTTGTTDADPDTLEVLQGQTITTFPEPPTRSAGWGAGMVFDSWATEDGTVFDSTTPVSDDIEVFAQWKFQAGTPQVDGETLVHVAPAMTNNTGDGGTQGTWNGSANTDGSWTYTGGAVRYKFPDDIDAYDFFTLELIASSTTTGALTSNILKQWNTGTDYFPRSGEGGVFPSIAQNTLFSREFEIRGAGTTGGIAIQTNNTNSKTIKWTKVTFTKGTRVQITFDTDGAGDLAPIRGVIGTTIGDLPAPEKEGYSFAGWEWTDGDAAPVAVTSATSVTKAMTLKAKWSVAVPVTPITVDFTAAATNLSTTGGDIVAGSLTATSFTFNKTATYAGGFAKFSVELPEGANLGAYGSVTVTIQAVSGDTGYKNVFLLAGSPNITSIGSDPSLTHSLNVGSNAPTFQSGTQTLTINIDPAKAASKTGTVQFCIYLHATAASWTFSNVTFNVK